MHPPSFIEGYETEFGGHLIALCPDGDRISTG